MWMEMEKGMGIAMVTRTEFPGGALYDSVSQSLCDCLLLLVLRPGVESPLLENYINSAIGTIFSFKALFTRIRTHIYPKFESNHQLGPCASKRLFKASMKILDDHKCCLYGVDVTKSGKSIVMVVLMIMIFVF